MSLQSESESNDAEDEYSMLWIGTLCAVVGNFLISFSFQLQRLAHRDNDKGIPYTRIPQWWMGFLLMACGEVGNFLAYGMAPASLVSPMGAIAVISNAVLSRVVLKEDLSKRKVIGVLVALAGSVIVALNAPAQQHGPSSEVDTALPPEEVVFQSLISWRALIYLLVVLLAFSYIANPLHWSCAISKEQRQEVVILNCFLCGLMGAITVMSSKGVSTALNQLFSGKTGMFVRLDICWLTYILIIAAVGSIILQMKYLNEALMHFGSSQVVPVYFVVFTSITISTGMVLFLELDFHPVARRLTLFVVGLLLSFVGVYLVNALSAEAALEHDDALLPASREELQKVFEEISISDSKNESLGACGDLESVNGSRNPGGGGGINLRGIRTLAVALGEEEQEHFAASLLHSLGARGSPDMSFPEFEAWYHHDYCPSDEPRLSGVHRRRLGAREQLRARTLKAQTDLLTVFSPHGSPLASAFQLHRLRRRPRFPSALELESVLSLSASSHGEPRSVPLVLRAHHRDRPRRAPRPSGPPALEGTFLASSVQSRANPEAGVIQTFNTNSAMSPILPPPGMVMVSPQALFSFDPARQPFPALSLASPPAATLALAPRQLPSLRSPDSVAAGAAVAASNQPRDSTPPAATHASSATIIFGAA